MKNISNLIAIKTIRCNKIILPKLKQISSDALLSVAVPLTRDPIKWHSTDSNLVLNNFLTSVLIVQCIGLFSSCSFLVKQELNDAIKSPSKNDLISSAVYKTIKKLLNWTSPNSYQRHLRWNFSTLIGPKGVTCDTNLFSLLPMLLVRFVLLLFLLSKGS